MDSHDETSGEGAVKAEFRVYEATVTSIMINMS